MMIHPHSCLAAVWAGGPVPRGREAITLWTGVFAPFLRFPAVVPGIESRTSGHDAVLMTDNRSDDIGGETIIEVARHA